MNEHVRDLFSDPPPLARNLDPVTSREAIPSKERRLRHFAIIIAAMRDGCRPLASEQIADVTSLDHSQVWRRMSELADEGLIERTIERHTNRSGRSAFRYVLTEKGRGYGR